MTRLRLAIRWTGNFPGGRTINDFVKLTDLAAWPDVYPVPDAATAGPPVTVVKETSPGFDTVTLSVPMTPDDKKFARLKVAITP